MSPTQQQGSQKPLPTTNTKPNRLPAPTLFVGPPSRNASQLSVSRQLPETGRTRNPLSRHQSTLSKAHDAESFNGDAKHSGVHDNGKGSTDAPRLRKDSERSVDVRWREMQNTLNEVELTAQSSTHVFGASHAAALDDLRKAQVELAQAWGRGSEEVSLENADDVGEMEVHRFKGADDLAADRVKTSIGSTGPSTRKRGDTQSSVSTVLSDSSVRSNETARSGRSQLEEETKEDIRRASERRGANEAYFKKVEKSVNDVVAKLEVVAEAMRGVEGESRSLWSGSSESVAREQQEQGSQKNTVSAVK